MLSEVPGIIEASMTITPNPDGRVSFSVLIGAGGKAGLDVIELIVRPEDVRYALDGAKSPSLVTSGQERDEEAPTFPCHLGFSRTAP